MSNPWNIPLYSGRRERPQGAPTLPPPVVPRVCIPDGAVLWLDGQEPDTIIAPGGNVQRWLDRSGANNHAEQPLAARQPLAVPDGIQL